MGPGEASIRDRAPIGVHSHAVLFCPPVATPWSGGIGVAGGVSRFRQRATR
jgi:hypothetical protein